MASDLKDCVWPKSRLAEALSAIAPGTRADRGEALHPPAPSEDLDGWLASLADRIEMEVEPATLPYSGLANCLREAGPALLQIRDGFIVLPCGKARVLTPDLTIRRFRPQNLAQALCEDVEAPIREQVDALLDAAGAAPGRRRNKVGAAIVRERLGAKNLGGCWLLRPTPGSGFRIQLRQARLPQSVLLLGTAHLAQYLLFIGSWWMLGAGALRGRIDAGWLAAWALMLLTMIPLRVLATWLQGSIAIRAGGILKQRLLAGALRLEPDEIRSEGAGQLLGRVLESQQVEALALSGGFLALVAGIEMALAAAVLFGGCSWSEPLVLVAWLAVTFGVTWRYIVRSDFWTGVRLAMTHDLVEKMVGHRTRLAQERPEDWHRGEDEALEGYLKLSQGLDRIAVLLQALVPRGWLTLGLAALAPAFISGTASPAKIAVTIGGVLLGYRALKRLVGGLWQLGGAAIAWKRTALLFHAAARREPEGLPSFAGSTAEKSDGDVVELREVGFRYRESGPPVLRGCGLRIRSGDRLLLEGPSGGGKSTLAAVITGLRVPQSGAVLLKGLDRRSVGSEGWRRMIVSAPQFHENHVLTGTFAFNLMMGTRWPPNPDDFIEMETLCRELGLGELLRRMPAGLLQCVGDTGWQLSHGERSRLYIARALLQKAELVVLDESFAALDPENLRRAVDCVLARTRTLLVIAHP